MLILDYSVNFVSLDINCAEGSGRAEVLTCSATDAALSVDYRYLGRIGVVIV